MRFSEGTGVRHLGHVPPRIGVDGVRGCRRRGIALGLIVVAVGQHAQVGTGGDGDAVDRGNSGRGVIVVDGAGIGDWAEIAVVPAALYSV